jgi:hypothetical protein
MAIARTTGEAIDSEEGVNEGEEECGDDPCDGCCCSKRPGALPTEPLLNLLSPLMVVLDEPEKTFVFGEFERGLLNGYQCFHHRSLVSGLAGLYPVIN